MSNVFSTQNYSAYSGLELVSENLLITLGLKYVDVVASYTLLDTGGEISSFLFLWYLMFHLSFLHRVNEILLHSKHIF